MSEPLVSVIIPTFNRAHLIGRALDSLLAQTHKHWEVIIVDDGSTDETQSVLAAYYADPRFRLYTHEINMGITSARNTGLDNIMGDWFCFLSSDDELVSTAIETMLAVPALVGDGAINTVMCNSHDIGGGGCAGYGLKAGYLESNALMVGESWMLVKTDVLGADRMIEGLNTFESEWMLRIMKRQKRYFIEDVLYIYHTEEEDRVSLSYSNGTESISYYEQWAIVVDENPAYLYERYNAGLGNAFPGVIDLCLQNGDSERARRVLDLAMLYGLQPEMPVESVLQVIRVGPIERIKRVIVTLLRFFRLKPPHPESK